MTLPDAKTLAYDGFVVCTGTGGSGDIYVGGDLSMNLSPALGMNAVSHELTMSTGQNLTMDLETDEFNVNIQKYVNINLGNC